MAESVTTSDMLLPHEAADAAELRDTDILFAHNWADKVIVLHGFQTNITRAQTIAETREGLQYYPRLGVTYSILVDNARRLLRIRSLLQRRTSSRTLTALYSDETHLTVAAAAGTSILTCDTTHRRFFVGMRIALLKPRLSGAKAGELGTNFEYGTIESLTATTITIQELLSADYRIGDSVLPMMETDIQLEASANAETDLAGTARITAMQSIGTMALLALAEPNDAPIEFSDYSGYPILTTPFHWSEMPFGVERPAESSNSGLIAVHTLKGDRAVQTGSLHFLFDSRAAAFSFLRFFDSRRGKLYLFFVISPATELSAWDVGIDAIEIDAIDILTDWDFYPYIGVVLKNGTKYIRKVGFASRDGDRDTVTLTEDLPVIAAGDIDRVTLAYLMRFNTDEMQEEWHTLEVMECKLPVVEVIQENTNGVEIPDPRTGEENPPGDPDTDGETNEPPETPVIPVTDYCTGLAADLHVPAGTFSVGTHWIYDPTTNLVYVVDTALTVDATPVDSTEIAGWELLDGEPPQVTQPWIPECPEPPEDPCALGKCIEVWTVAMNEDGSTGFGPAVTQRGCCGEGGIPDGPYNQWFPDIVPSIFYYKRALGILCTDPNCIVEWEGDDFEPLPLPEYP